MANSKSDARKFCETMWIMVKYDVLPWLLGAGMVALTIVGVQRAQGKRLENKEKIEKFLNIKSDGLNQQHCR